MSDNREPTELTALEGLIREVIGGMYFCRPGYIEAFDPATQLATVTPAIMVKANLDEKVEYKKFKPLVNVPVVIPYVQSAGLAVTLPIKKGDECLLLFSDRFLDDFLEHGAQEGNAKPEACGGDNLTCEPRMHHLADAVCIPGIISLPKAIPNYNPDHMEMRTKDGRNFVRLGSGDYGIRLTAGGGFDQGGSDIRMQGGKIWLYGAEEINTRTAKTWSEQPPVATGGTRGPTMPE